MLKRYRYRAYPTAEQEALLARTFGCVRVVYNDAVRLRQETRAAGDRISDAEVQRRVVTLAKQCPEREWLGEASAVALTQACRDALKAYRNFFNSIAGTHRGRKVGAPRFKSRKNARQAFRLVGDAFTATERGVRLAKIGEVKLKWSRELPSTPTSVTVIREADGRYYASFVVEVQQTPLPEATRAAGLDLGLHDLATIVYSDGRREKVPALRHLRRAEARLKKAQRALSRKERGSKNRQKARVKVARLHRKVRETRLDQHHKLAHRLIHENQVIAVEDLSVAGLARTTLAKSVHDAGWSVLTRLLEEKAGQYAREVVKIDRWFPSTRTCSQCGVVGEKKPLDVRVWTCGCGETLDRDYNAALNILDAAGLAESLNARGADVRRELACAIGREAGTRCGSQEQKAS